MRFIHLSKHTKPALALLSTVVTVAIAGCGGAGQREVAPTKGIVTIDGKPLPQGRVTTEPIAQEPGTKPGKAGFGIIQPDGTFVLGTYDTDDGAIVGPHRITLYGQPPYQPESDENLDAKPKKKVRPPFDVLRVIGQNFEVLPDQENLLEIKLTSQMVKQYGERDN